MRTLPQLRVTRSRGALVLLAATALSGVAIGQTASEITPDTFRPAPQRLAGSVEFTGQTGLTAPAGADRLSVRISDVTVDGTLPGMEGPTRVLANRLTAGGPVLVSDIFAAASDLEAAYAEAGYVLARVVLPPQSLRDGDALRLSVVDGYVESIDASAVPAAVRPRLETLTADLIGKRGVRLSEIERRLLLAGDTYGVALGSALATGASPGGTVVILQPEYRDTTGFVGIDNLSSDALGPISVDAGIEFNGYLGRGEVLYGRLSGDPETFFSSDPKQRSVAVGVVYPLGSDGLSFNLEATVSETHPDVVGPETDSTFSRLSARLYYPWVRSRDFNVTTQLSFDVQQDSLDLITGAGPIGLYEDRTRAARAAIDAAWVTSSGALVESGAILSRGIDGLGARGAADATPDLPLSRPGADSAFTKLELSARWRQRVAETVGVSLAGRAQTSFGDPLVTAEQIGIASADEMSSFDSGALSGDRGWVVRGEVSYPLEMDLSNSPLSVSPYLFAATGEVVRERPEAGEAERVRADAFGLGVELLAVQNPRFSTGSLRLEVGKGNRDDGGTDGTRVSVVGTYRF